MSNYQAEFHQHWNHLHDPDVRALAWLLSAPDLLDSQAPRWHNQIASLAFDPGFDLNTWLIAQDTYSEPLHTFLQVRPRLRLGHYAEKLMAFYFQARGILDAYSLQVQADKTTVGEFDFLLRDGLNLVHWEFATKFYLLQTDGELDHFMGPSLADTLSNKVHKILQRQLVLGQHPSAQAVLRQPISHAQALIKGWLFYHHDRPTAQPVSGLNAEHCRGAWCALHEFNVSSALQGDLFAVLPRLRWLAPARLAWKDCCTKHSLQQQMNDYFSRNRTPLLVVVLDPSGDVALETSRCFVVPDNWPGDATAWLAQHDLV